MLLLLILLLLRFGNSYRRVPLRSSLILVETQSYLSASAATSSGFGTCLRLGNILISPLRFILVEVESSASDLSSLSRFDFGFCGKYSYYPVRGKHNNKLGKGAHSWGSRFLSSFRFDVLYAGLKILNRANVMEVPGLCNQLCPSLQCCSLLHLS